MIQKWPHVRFTCDNYLASSAAYKCNTHVDQGSNYDIGEALDYALT